MKLVSVIKSIKIDPSEWIAIRLLDPEKMKVKIYPGTICIHNAQMDGKSRYISHQGVNVAYLYIAHNWLNINGTTEIDNGGPSFRKTPVRNRFLIYRTGKYERQCSTVQNLNSERDDRQNTIAISPRIFTFLFKITRKNRLLLRGNRKYSLFNLQTWPTW